MAKLHYFYPLIAVSMALSGCALSEADNVPAPISAKAAKQLDKELSGKVAGESVSCIPSTHTIDSIRISDDMLLYRVSGRLVYQNKLRSPCTGLASDRDIMVIETHGGQYCRGDFIRLVDRNSGFSGSVCSLGDFTPYRKAKDGAG